MNQAEISDAKFRADHRASRAQLMALGQHHDATVAHPVDIGFDRIRSEYGLDVVIGTEREQQPVDAGASAVAQGQPHAGHRERTIVVPEMLRLVGRRAVVLNEEQEVEIRVLQCQQALVAEAEIS